MSFARSVSIWQNCPGQNIFIQFLQKLNLIEMELVLFQYLLNTCTTGTRCDSKLSCTHSTVHFNLPIMTSFYFKQSQFPEISPPITHNFTRNMWLSDFRIPIGDFRTRQNQYLEQFLCDIHKYVCSTFVYVNFDRQILE